MAILGFPSGSQQKTIPSIKINKIQPYLYSLDYSEITNQDYSDAAEWLRNYYAPVGGCSSARKENFWLRNYDWLYDNSAEFIVRTHKGGAVKYDSIGMASGYKITEEDMENPDLTDERFRFIPFHVVDGINECGVIANSNVTAKGDMGKTTGTHPAGEEMEMCAIALIRFILDNYDNATDAVNYIKDHISVYMPSKEGELDEELHLMVGDKNKTYLIEFVYNTCVVTEMTDNKIMTNFYLEDTEYNEDGEVIKSSVTDHGVGIERYNIVARELKAITEPTANGMINLARHIWYTNAYGTNAGIWYSEFVGGDLTNSSPPEAFDEIRALAAQAYATRNRNNPLTWQTVHTSVYDIDTQTMYLLVQEEDLSNLKAYKLNEPINANNVVYDNTTSGLTAKNVQAAIDELSEREDRGVGEATVNGGEIFNDYNQNIATGQYTHAEGSGTIAEGQFQHVQGKYNIADSADKYSFIIGNGTDSDNRSNAFAIDWQGKIYVNNTNEGIDLSEIAQEVLGINSLLGTGVIT